jgi:hypothetical protein
MQGRIRRIAAAFVIAMSTLGSLGATSALAVYVDLCAAPADNQHATLDKPNITNGVLDAVADIVYLRTTRACIGNASVVGQSYVWPISLQDGSCEQLGWGMTNWVSTRWYLTTSDTSGCVVSAPGSFPNPVVGHSYHLRIYATTCLGSPGWMYQVTDNTAGGSYAYCGSRNGTKPGHLWSGFEVWNINDQMGGAGVSQYIHDIGYSSTVGGAKTYLTTTTVSKGCCNAVWMPYWHASAQLDPDGHSIIGAYTADH